MARTGKRSRRRERPHRPEELGPRIIWHGRWAGADLRPWGGGRVTLRNPKAAGWPKKGERTTDEEVARKWMWAYVERIRDGEKRKHLGLKSSRPIGPLLDEWLRQREAEGKAASTIQSNRTIVKQLKEWAVEDTPIEHIRGRRTDARDPEDATLYLQDYFDELRAAGYATRTIVTTRAILSGFFNWAGHPIVREVKVAQPEDRDVFFWSDVQMKRIRKAADRIDEIREAPFPQARLAVELDVASGARQNELFGIRWQDLDEDESSIRIWRQRTRLSGGFKELKGKENRTALVLPSLWEYLNEHVPDWRDRDGLILHDGNDKLARYSSTTYLVQRILDTANLNDINRGWHDFRRTYGVTFLRLTSGSGMHLLQVYLGHKDLKTTQRTYGHLSSDHAVHIGRDLVDGKSLRII